MKITTNDKVYKFVVQIQGTDELVPLSIIGRNRDDAALNVPSEVCRKLGRTISMYKMQIVEG